MVNVLRFKGNVDLSELVDAPSKLVDAPLGDNKMAVNE